MLTPHINTTANFTNRTSLPSTLNACFSIKCYFTNAERITIIGVFFLTFLVSLVGNSTVCFIIARSKKLKSCTNFSILNLSIADLFITVFVIPILTLDMYVLEDWIYGLFMCRLVAFLQNMAMVTSILILLSISIEKFLVVCFPFRSRIYRNSFRYFIYVAWLLAITDSAAVCTLKIEIQTFLGKTRCVSAWPNKQFKQNYLMGHGIGLFFLPLLLMTALHCATIIAIQRRSTQQIEGRKTIIRANVRKLKQKRKAVTILVLIVIMFAISWGPFLTLAIWEAFVDINVLVESFKLVNQVFVVCMWMVFLNAACHPIIYCFLGKQYRKAMKQSLWKKNTTSRSNTRYSPRDQQPAIPLRNLDLS